MFKINFGLEVQPYLLFQFGPIWGLIFFFVWFDPVWGVFALVGPFIKEFLNQGKIQFLYCDQLTQTINFGLEVQPYLIILIWPHLGVFLAVFRPFGAFFGLDLGLKTFLKPVYVDYQFWLWNYSPIWFFSFGHFWGLFGSFWAPWGYFWVWVQVQILFWDLLTQPNNFCFGSMWFLQLFHTFLGGWVGGLIS